MSETLQSMENMISHFSLCKYANMIYGMRAEEIEKIISKGHKLADHQ